MTPLKTIIVASLLISFASCESIKTQPPNPDVTKKIVQICIASDFFKFVNGAVELAYPAATIPVSILNSGIDTVCTNPEKFSSDISTVEWLKKNMPPLMLHQKQI